MHTHIIYKTGWALIILIAAVPVMRWIQLNGFISFDTSYGFFSDTGRVAGLVALSLYAINFLLSTRARILDTLFGGLNKAYISHHIVGSLALIIMLAHPILLALSFLPDAGRQAALLLVPSPFPPYDWALIFGRLGLGLTIALLIITFYVKLPYQRWRRTHQLIGVAFLLIGLHVYLIPSDTSRDLFLRIYMLSLIGAGLTAYAYRTLFGRILVRRHRMIVSNVRQLGDRAVQISLQPPDGAESIDFAAGQFIFMRVHQPGIADEFHPFSITSKTGSREITIIARSLGDFTRSLHSLKPGAAADIEGAFGKFSAHAPAGAPQIWIAGGIGITPFLGMAKSLADQREVELFYAAESASDLGEYDKLVREAAGTAGSPALHAYDTTAHQKFISAEYVRSTTDFDVTASHILLCGPPSMVRSLRTQFELLGVPKHHIHSEEFSII